MGAAARRGRSSRPETTNARRERAADPAARARRDRTPSVEIGVLLIAARADEAKGLAEELGERLAPSHIMQASTVADALAIGLGGVDCVVLDVGSVGGRSGVEAVRHLRSGVSDDVPVIVLLDGADESTGEAAVRFGAQGYLIKSELRPGELARSVNGTVRDRQAELAERELSLAQERAREVARLERGLSPRPLLRDASISVASLYKTGRSRALLGGDFIDLVQLDEHRARLVVGDVCGHGPDEAAVGVSLRAAWRALAISDMPMVPATHTLESLFVHERHLPALFVTLCSIDLDLEGPTAEVLVAGHPRPILIDDESAGALAETGGRALGIGRGEWATERVELRRGWTILAYTDGLIEGRTGEGPERLGEEGAHRLIGEEMRQRPGWRTDARGLLNEIVDATEGLNGGPLSDDVAMMLVGEGAGRAGR